MEDNEFKDLLLKYLTNRNQNKFKHYHINTPVLKQVLPCKGMSLFMTELFSKMSVLIYIFLYIFYI